MRPVHVFVPARLSNGQLVCPDYDDPEYLADLGSAFASIGVSWTWVPVTLVDLAQRVREAAQAGAVVLNLCDGDPSQGLPGVESVVELEAQGVAYSGADRFFYQITTSRHGMKTRLRAAGVPQPNWTRLMGPELDGSAVFPAILKPDVSGGSYGIEKTSVVADVAQLERQVQRLFSGDLHGRDFRRDGAVLEEFIDGPEYSVLVVGDWNQPDTIEVLPPVERFFADAWPAILTYEINWERYGDDGPPVASGAPFWHGKVVSADPSELADLARKAYIAVGGVGYGRVDLRRRAQAGTFAVLEVNANCGLSSDPHTSTVGAILSLHGRTFGALLADLLARGQSRFEARAKTIHAFVPALDSNDKICWGYGEETFRSDFERAMERSGRALSWRPVWRQMVAQGCNVASGDIVFNICDGDDATYPGISVVQRLAALGVAHTGADAPFYQISTSKTAMKAVLAEHGVATAAWAGFDGDQAAFFAAIEQQVGFPCLFKPDISAGSFGIRKASRVGSREALEEQFAQLREGCDECQDLTSGWFAEAFVSGREFTVLVSGDASLPETLLVHTPLEYRFAANLPAEERFLFYARRYESDAPEGEPDRYVYQYPEFELDGLLRATAKAAYLALGGRGYARVDMRCDEATGVIYVLEVNANCGLGSDPLISTMGAILARDQESYASFLNRAIGLAAV